jgi:hypothetical protein
MSLLCSLFSLKEMIHVSYVLEGKKTSCSLICYGACRDLSSNSGLSGPLPTSIGNLRQLTTLYVLTGANSYIS